MAALNVDEAAFAGRGELAFVSRGQLWVLDGATGTLRRVPVPRMMTPLDPQFSRDGRWLAFLSSSSSPSAQGYTVWLAPGDGGVAREVVASGGLIGWSPAADVLAVTAGNTIRLVEPSGAARTLVRAPGVGSGVWPGVGSAVWSPDGGSLAVSLGSARAGTLASYPLTGGPPVTWLRLTGQDGNYLIDPAGWWPGSGIGYWAVGDCDSCNEDGDGFYVIRSPGAHPRLLGSTLADAGLDQVAAAPDGRLAIVAETPGPGMGGRLIWQDRTVKICALAPAACADVPSPASTVTLDPAWPPGGGTLALVRSPYRASAGFPQGVVADWYEAHTLWLYDPARRSLRELKAAGASVPTWSADGKSLLCVARDELWLLPSLSGRPVRVAGPLFPPGNWPAYYGQVRWLSQFAWWQG